MRRQASYAGRGEKEKEIKITLLAKLPSERSVFHIIGRSRSGVTGIGIKDIVVGIQYKRLVQDAELGVEELLMREHIPNCYLFSESTLGIYLMDK